ncbi:MAG TPA: helix-turn-helix transcriptional regulator [Micromonosporaceae bacterium]|nr:helix-turn-helix transcriptional regulator [Micromonosporaceae bacterium]
MPADARVRAPSPAQPAESHRTVRGPVAARRRLRAALRRARDRQSLTQDQVAEAMEWSLSKLIRIESGLVGISTNDLRALLDYYHLAEPDEIARLVELARVGRAKPWWSDYRDVLSSPHFMTMLGLEADARLLRVFNSSVLPGLMQTEAYARGSLQSLVPGPTVEQLEVKVAVRLRRQAELLDRQDPPDLLAVLDESVLRRMIADVDAMRAQLRHLCALAERPNVTIEVVPFSAGVYDLAGPFTILAFPDGADAEVVYLESALNEDLIEDAEKIQPYHVAFDALRAKALSPRDSIVLIERVASELR